MTTIEQLGEMIAGVVQLDGVCIAYRGPAGDVEVYATQKPDEVAALKAFAAELSEDSPHYDCDEVHSAIAEGREPKRLDEVSS